MEVAEAEAITPSLLYYEYLVSQPTQHQQNGLLKTVTLGHWGTCYCSQKSPG